jgi:hypothetical protein
LAATERTVSACARSEPPLPSCTCPLPPFPSTCGSSRRLRHSHVMQVLVERCQLQGFEEVLLGEALRLLEDPEVRACDQGLAQALPGSKVY